MARENSVELLPEGAELLPDTGGVSFAGGGDDYDVSNLSVSFSTEEASSEARSFELLPTGKYHIKVTDVETKFSTSVKNNGKPYYALTLTVQSGKFENRKLWPNVMLFPGALYTLAQIMKAMGREPGNNVKVPTPDELLSYDFIVTVQRVVDQYRIDKGEWSPSSGEPKPMKNEVRGFSPFKHEGSVGASGGTVGNTLLP